MKELLSRDFLLVEYIQKEKPIHQIASENHVSVGAVFNYLHRYGIETRKCMTAEARAKIGEANRHRVNTRKGIPMSEETKEKLRLINLGRYRTPTEFGGHKKKKSDGYYRVYCPNHPHSSKDGYVMEHILVMEKHIGRYLNEDEVVHHINHVRDDNRIENLQLMTFKEHSSLHMKERWEKKKGVKTYQ